MKPVVLLSVLLTLVSTTLATNDLQLLIYHNNDMHARFEETSKTSGLCLKKGSCYGGFARVAYMVKKARTEAKQGRGPAVLFLNAGDTYTGTSWFGVHKWKIAVDFLNALKPDAASLGNHEFDQGLPGLIPFLDSVNFPVVTCNLNLDNETSLSNTPLKKSVVLEVAGHQIGIVGYLTPDTKLLSNTGNVKFLDEIVSITEESEKLHKQGIKTIFAVGHSGYMMDKLIAEKVPLVDLVIGGHTNTFLWNGAEPDLEKSEGPYPTVITQPSGKKVPVVQAYAYTKYLGALNITIGSNGKIKSYSGQPILLDSSIPQEDDVLQLLEKYRPEITALSKQVVGKTKVFLGGEGIACRTSECNLGNLIADSMIAFLADKYSGLYWTDTAIAIQNGGGVRNSVSVGHKDGNITQSDLLSVLPFGSNLYTLELQGSDLLKMLEWSVHSNGETSRGEFLQMSGIQVVYDLNMPVGRRVKKVSVRCSMCNVPKYELLKLEEMYRIAAFSFIVEGGDGYDIIKNNGKNKILEEVRDLDVLAWYLKNQKLAIYPGIENRIMFSDRNNMLSSTPHSSSSMNTRNLILLVLSILYQIKGAFR